MAERRALLTFYARSTIFVVGFLGFRLFYGRGKHRTIADYWRWFVVHIWVDSTLEFFGIAVISLFLVAMGLVSAKSALCEAYLTAILVFLRGMPGTADHYSWSGGPSASGWPSEAWSTCSNVPDRIIVVVEDLPLLYFLISTLPRLREVE